MAEHSPKLSQSKVAIIGSNIHSALAYQALSELNPAEIAWFRSEREDQDLNRESFFCLLPEQMVAKLKIDKEFVHEIDPVIFFEGHRHESLDNFLRNPHHTFTKRLSPSIRAKIESITFWNDLTPFPLEKNGDIRFSWPDEEAHSKTSRKTKKFFLINRAAFLKDLQRKHSKVLELTCINVDQGDKANDLKLIFKAPAPAPAQSFDALLWTSQFAQPKPEKASKLQPKLKRQLPEAYWKSYHTRLPAHAINALPRFSVWIPDTNEGRELCETGCLKSGSLMRAYKGSENYLQIDLLEISGESLPKTLQQNPARALEGYVPFIKEHDIVWNERLLDENVIYHSPFPFIHSFASNFDFWSGGPLSDLHQSISLKALWAKSQLFTST